MQPQTYHHPSSDSQVPIERWVWQCKYDGNTELHQFNDADHTFHNFGEIDQTKLQTFHMRNTTTGQTLTMLFPAGAKLIHFYRNAGLDVGGPGERYVRLYCFGYEYGSISCKFVITPTDEIIFTDNFDRVEVS
jgi:hypothetical protein